MDDFKVGSRCRAISNTSKKGHLHTTTQEQTTTINLKTFSSSLRHSSQQRRGPAPGGQLQVQVVVFKGKIASNATAAP